jgi:DNA mismatch repair protein MutL
VGKIQLLADDVINQIAAGEVVERPASVVKELVENALDAGARDVQVELVDGGCKSIAVVDDGCGMEEGDALLALRRHATSKIRSVDDLYVASSMGFRGEALASIASVSRLTLTTRERSAAAGTRIELDGSANPEVKRNVAAAPGTSLSCRDLFFNVPARLKFLKSPASELGAVSEFFDAAILCWPAVRLRLVNNRREVVAAAAAQPEDGRIGESALRTRAAAVFGNEVAAQLIYVHEADVHASVEGLVSPPGVEKVNSKSMFTFVNHRWVKDKTLRYAIQRGYHSHLLKGKYPVVALHVTVDPALVDVNVHPAKTEVRFQYGSEVQAVVVRAIMKALRKGDWARPMFSPAPVMDENTPVREVWATPATTSWRPSPMASATRRVYDAVTVPVRDDAPDFSQAAPAEIPWAQMKFLGSVGKCYLMFTDGDRLLAVDQHAWHERIIFERLSRDRTLLHQSQTLMIPELVELPAASIDALRSGLTTLVDNGFALEITGETSVEVAGVPSILAHRDPQEMLSLLSQKGFGSSATADLAQDLLATYACHSAVRAGEELGPDELARLMREASEVDFQHNCPHGRRVFRWWESDQIGRWFDR